MPKIVSARVVVTSPGRNFVTLKITCDDGTTGLGDATLNGRELAVAAYLSEHVVPCLIGRDAHRIEDAWQFLYKGAYWRRGPVTMTAIAAVDTALWDIKGKLAGLPVYQLLGGASRDACLVYCHANGTSIADTIAEAKAHMAEGYRAVRLQCGVPGLASTYGVAKAGQRYEPADADLPTESVWSTPQYLRVVPELFAAAREERALAMRAAPQATQQEVEEALMDRLGRLAWAHRDARAQEWRTAVAHVERLRAEGVAVADMDDRPPPGWMPEPPRGKARQVIFDP
jgi:mannonate dehydratase